MTSYFLGNVTVVNEKSEYSVKIQRTFTSAWNKE